MYRTIEAQAFCVVEAEMHEKRVKDMRDQQRQQVPLDEPSSRAGAGRARRRR
jgi:hypothetical protein